MRNPPAERRALDALARYGFTGDSGETLAPIVGCREVLNFLGRGLTALRRRGWKVELTGRIAPYLDSLDFVAPVVAIRDEPGSGRFEVGFRFEDREGERLAPADIQRAIAILSELL